MMPQISEELIVPLKESGIRITFFMHIPLWRKAGQILSGFPILEMFAPARVK